MSLLNILYILPKNWLSHLTGRIVGARLPLNFHTKIKLWFIRKYNVNTDEARLAVEDYTTLGNFFIRDLKEGERPIAHDTLVSPCDGKVTGGGLLQGNEPGLPQIKGRLYSLSKLLDPYIDGREFSEGLYSVIYLAPFNYHRVHSPIVGELKSLTHVPGELWPVNGWSINKIEGLFYRNERLTFEFKAPAGRVLVIMVGATNVGKMTTCLNGDFVGNQPGPRVNRHWIPEEPIQVQKGQEIGCFEMGSTVILIMDNEFRQSLDEGPAGSGSNSYEVTPQSWRDIKMGEVLIP